MSRGGEQIKVSEVAGLIDQIEAGGGGKAYVVVIPSNDKNGQVGQLRGSGVTEQNNIKNIPVYLDQTKTQYNIRIYEIDPSDATHYIRGESTDEGDNYSAYVSQKFNEAKIYFVDCKDLSFVV